MTPKQVRLDISPKTWQNKSNFLFLETGPVPVNTGETNDIIAKTKLSTKKRFVFFYRRLQTAETC